MTGTPGGSKILFLSANAGTGHNVAARALADALTLQDPSFSCKVLNSYDFLDQPLGKVIEDGYFYLLRLLPRIYGYFYDRKNKKKSISSAKNWLNCISAANFRKVIMEEKPDLVVCTHAFPCGVMSELKRQYGLDIKVLGVVTDFVVSPFWIYPETDGYMVATEDLKSYFYRRGINGGRVQATGIPIDPRFNGKGPGKAEARKKLGLDPEKPVLLVMGGGWGMNPASGCMQILKKLKMPLQALVITGQNQKEKKKLEDSAAQLNGTCVDVKVYGYVENVFDFMKAADLLVTKPGGLTTAEAIAAGLPMIVTSPIPGQESKNVRYLINKGVAVPVFNEDELPAHIEKLLADRDALGDLSCRALQFAVPDSATRAASYIRSFLAPAL